MLFNTLQFFVFFFVVYGLYLACRSHRWQNRLLLTASCIFYAAWDWRFLLLMFVSITTDYVCSLRIQETRVASARRRWLVVSLAVNLSILGFFKYFNFFVDNLQSLLINIGLPAHWHVFRVILPVGISFYTFEAMSYTIDVYRRQCVPTRNFIDYALFVTYFPHLVAGPIMRARNLLPQIQSVRRISLEKFYEGCYLIFWGLFQKVFVADNLARIVDPVFSAHSWHGSQVLLALYAFAFQIYCDFAGYSNIARGLGACMGFDIMINFNTPYFAVHPQDFWRRWHISLSSWLRDYLYIPLGGNAKGVARTFRNLIITMFLGGLWHGAAWTYVIWGMYHGILLIGHRVCQIATERMPFPGEGPLRGIWMAFKWAVFFHLVCFGWLIFRATSLAQVQQMGAALVHPPWAWDGSVLLKTVFFVWPVVVMEALQFRKNDPLVVFRWHTVTRAVFYVICFYLLVLFGVEGGKEFVYFKF